MSVPSQFRFLFFFAAVSLVGCSAPVDDSTDELPEIGERIGEVREAVSEDDNERWKMLMPGSRKIAILERAQQDEGQYVGLNCKEWVRKVVLDASYGVVTLPPTTQGGVGWEWNSSPYVQQLTDIYSASFGDIVQMNIHLRKSSSGPHSAIVSSRNGDNICWIESNWREKTQPNTVFTRCETVQDFLNRVTFDDVQKYRAYQITGKN